jgi:hypothetical protein
MTVEQTWWSTLSVSDRMFFILKWEEDTNTKIDPFKLYLDSQTPKKIYEYVHSAKQQNDGSIRLSSNRN